MTLTPQDIQTQQFHVRFRGFDVDEVDSFLEKVAEVLLALSEENKLLTAKIEEMTKEVVTYHTQEKTFQNAILSAQNIADEMKEKSRHEAEVMLAKALEDAKQIREEASAETEKLKQEIDQLNELKNKIKGDMRQLLQGYLERIEQEPEAVASASPTLEPASAPPTPEPLVAGPEEPASEEEDLSDLYEKIDLPDDLLGASPTDEEADSVDQQTDDSISEDSQILAMNDDEQEDETAVPDLDDDLVFTLEDPLDEGETTINFDDDEIEGKQQGAGS